MHRNISKTSLLEQFLIGLEFSWAWIEKDKAFFLHFCQAMLVGLVRLYWPVWFDEVFFVIWGLPTKIDFRFRFKTHFFFQVRWQHEDDSEDCSSCRQQFNMAKRKHHCRHCGRIFCADCLTKTVTSGPQNRPSKVCEVCHTLLVQNSAPYFSTVVPSISDGSGTAKN